MSPLAYAARRSNLGSLGGNVVNHSTIKGLESLTAPSVQSGARRSARVEISVVSPIYKCGDCVAELHRQLVFALESLVPSFEIVLVNDGCPANSWAAVRAVAALDPRVKAINLSRNFGQHYAIAAGVHHSSGNWVVVMDCDLQDRPAEIPNLYRKALEGYDIVYALRHNRLDTWRKRALSRGFAAIYNFLSDIKIDPRACNFSIASRQVIEGYCRLKELNRSYHLLLRWLGFRYTYLQVEHSDRFAGRSAYNIRRGFLLAIESVTSQSNKPLVLSIRAGFLMSGSALLVGLYLILRYLTHGIGVTGWTSVIVSLYFIGGLILANLGVVGLYMGKVFNEVKERPLYLVKEMVNFESGEAAEASERGALFSQPGPH
jgi:glycosyltransferase involved in cell wall biosynthesis